MEQAKYLFYFCIQEFGINHTGFESSQDVREKMIDSARGGTSGVFLMDTPHLTEGAILSWS